MCAIVDADIWGEVFGKQTPAGAFFYQWLRKYGRLIFGGTRMIEQVHMDPQRMTTRQTDTSEESPNKKRFRELVRSGRLEQVSKKEVDDKEQELIQQGGWESKGKDCHILALTLLRQSEVRVLYSKDIPLHEDFKKIQKGRGKRRAWIYSGGPAHMRKLDTTRCG